MNLAIENLSDKCVIREGAKTLGALTGGGRGRRCFGRSSQGEGQTQGSVRPPSQCRRPGDGLMRRFTDQVVSFLIR